MDSSPAMPWPSAKWRWPSANRRSRGLPAFVFARLPQLVERPATALKAAARSRPSTRCWPEGDDQQDPIADSARAILDGHVVLSRSLADAGHYPRHRHRAVDFTRDDQPDRPAHLDLVRRFKQLSLALPAGARPARGRAPSARGSDPMLDQAITLYPAWSISSRGSKSAPVRRRTACAPGRAVRVN